MEAGAAGVGLGDAPGAGVGVGLEPPTLEATSEDPAPPPQPIMNIANSVMEASESDVQRLCTANSPKVRSKVCVVLRTLTGSCLFRITANY